MARKCDCHTQIASWRSVLAVWISTESCFNSCSSWTSNGGIPLRLLAVQTPRSYLSRDKNKCSSKLKNHEVCSLTLGSKLVPASKSRWTPKSFAMAEVCLGLSSNFDRFPQCFWCSSIGTSRRVLFQCPGHLRIAGTCQIEFLIQNIIVL